MTPLLSLTNALLWLGAAAFILQLGRKRRLGERSSLSCLAASVVIYFAFQSSAVWNLLAGYETRFIIEHIFFMLAWIACAIFILACVKLTDFSRIRRALIQDLALLEAETARSPALSAPVRTEQVAEKV